MPTGNVDLLVRESGRQSAVLGSNPCESQIFNLIGHGFNKCDIIRRCYTNVLKTVSLSETFVYFFAM